MTQCEADEVDASLTDVPGIGEKTAENLRAMFNTDDAAMDAALSIPQWVLENIDGVGEQNLGHLQEYAEATDHQSSEEGNYNLDGKDFTKYEKTYKPVGKTTDNRVLFYSGYYQGRSYKTQITRQVLSRDKVNKYLWAFWSWSEWDFIFLHERNHPNRLGDRKLADFMDDYEWEEYTEFGLIEYQRGRYYELDDWPDNAKGQPYRTFSDPTRETSELRSMELVGITKDRIAIYAQDGRNGPSIRKFVRMPDGAFYQLHGRTQYGTDRDMELGEFGTVETLVEKLAENDEWKTYGSTTHVAEKYQEYL